MNLEIKSVTLSRSKMLAFRKVEVAILDVLKFGSVTMGVEKTGQNQPERI